MQGVVRKTRQSRAGAFLSNAVRSQSHRISAEVAGEIVLLTLTGAFFAYLLLESREWPLGAALMPRIVASSGLLFLALRITMLVRQNPRGQTRIMDTGFSSGKSDQGSARRFVWVFGALIALIIGIWLVGWHVALPAYVFLYLVLCGHVRWWSAALVAGAFLALLIGVYDAIFHTPWNEPALLRLIEH